MRRREMMTAPGRTGQYRPELPAPGWRTILLAVECRTDDPVTAPQLRILDRANFGQR